MSIRPRRALVGLVAAVAALALPAVASAAITPALTLNETATTAGSITTIGFDATFTGTGGDTPKDITFALPPGLLANENINGGACLLATSPSSSCQVGSGTLTAGGPVPVTIDLVAPPKSGDVGGLAVVAGGNTLTTGEVKLTATGLNVVFSNLTAGITEMNVSFTNLRLPTSCPSPADNVTLTADSQQSTTPASATAPLTVTGCSSLPYAPKLTAAITKDSNDSGATLVTEITQAANESASKTIVLQFPKGLTPNVAADVPCLTGSGPGCQVGTATAASPLVPSVALSNGVVTLGGSATAPTIAVTFPTLGITLPGTVSLTNNTVTFANVPDVPLTDLKLNVTGPSGGKAFNTDCAPANIGGTFTPQSGTAPVTVSSPITFTNCSLKPTASGSTSGLASGHPKLKFKVTHGKGAPNVSSVTVSLPGGLKFARSAIVSHKTCTKAKQGKKPKCTTTTLIKGLKITGAKAKSVAIKHGRLVITLKKAAGKVSITASGPLVTESKGLQTKVKKHKTKSLEFSLKVTDAKKTSTTVPLKLRAH